MIMNWYLRLEHTLKAFWWCKLTRQHRPVECSRMLEPPEFEFIGPGHARMTKRAVNQKWLECVFCRAPMTDG